MIITKFVGATGECIVECWAGEGGTIEGNGGDGDHQTLVQQSTGAASTGGQTVSKEGIV